MDEAGLLLLLLHQTGSRGEVGERMKDEDRCRRSRQQRPLNPATCEKGPRDIVVIPSSDRSPIPDSARLASSRRGSYGDERGKDKNLKIERVDGKAEARLKSL
jgi:hypothetical protein